MRKGGLQYTVQCACGVHVIYDENMYQLCMHLPTTEQRTERFEFMFIHQCDAGA